MCGISGAVVTTARAKEIALAISAQLERRGYDNAGLAVQIGGIFQTVKTVGATTELKPKAAQLQEGNVCIGHTRWATTGEVVERNAHPFRVGSIVGAGNGDVTNYATLRGALQASTVLTSEVDTEVAIAVISEAFDALEGDAESRLVQAIRVSIPRLEGSFALVLGADGFEGLVVLRHGLNTAFIGQLPDNAGFCVSSDEESLLEFTQEFFKLNENDFAVITTDGVRFLEGENFVTREVATSEFEAGAASKGAFSSFLEKEIYEQPECLRRLVSAGLPVCPDFTSIKNVVILACGSARLASKVGLSLLEAAGLPTRVVVASEFTSCPQLGDSSTLVIAVSQSGTTADVLEAVNAAKELGFGPLVAITNTPSSPLAGMADLVLPILSGPEISVASTKAVTSMVAVFALLVQCFKPEQKSGIREAAFLIDAMLKSPRFLKSCAITANVLADAETSPILVLGQGSGYTAAQEGALKLKELTALSTEAFPSRELKHGPIAMIQTGTRVIFCAIGLTEDTVIQQVKARGAFTIGIVEDNAKIAGAFDLVIHVPIQVSRATVLEKFCGNLIPLQLIALTLAQLLDKNVDRPANLAKSATTK
jgi:glutamine---fructose-6-phosphate transaminase (isomerizing)